MPSPKRLFALLLSLLMISGWIGCTTLDDGFDRSPPTSPPGEAMPNNINSTATEPFCYVITGTENKEDHVVTKLPLAENKKLLDALSSTPNLSLLSKKKMWVTRTDPTDGSKRILPIDQNLLLSEKAANHNYDLQPGDQIYVMAEKWKDYLDSVHAPFEQADSYTTGGIVHGTQLTGYRRTEF